MNVRIKLLHDTTTWSYTPTYAHEVYSEVVVRVSDQDAVNAWLTDWNHRANPDQQFKIQSEVSVDKPLALNLALSVLEGAVSMWDEL